MSTNKKIKKLKIVKSELYSDGEYLYRITVKEETGGEEKRYLYELEMGCIYSFDRHCGADCPAFILTEREETYILGLQCIPTLGMKEIQKKGTLLESLQKEYGEITNNNFTEF